MEQHFDTDQQVALIKVLSDLVTNANTPDNYFELSICDENYFEK